MKLEGPHVQERDVTHGWGRGRPYTLAAFAAMFFAALPAFISAEIYRNWIGKSFHEILNDTEGASGQIDSDFDFMLIIVVVVWFAASIASWKLADLYQAKNPNVWWYFRHAHDYCQKCQGKWEEVSRKVLDGAWVCTRDWEPKRWQRRLKAMQSVRCPNCKRKKSREAIFDQTGWGAYTGEQKQPEGSGGG